MSAPTVFINPHVRDSVPVRSDAAEAEAAVLAFHKTLSAYDETPLRALPALARDLGVGHVFVKDESSRFGLPSFKILGASWAVHRAVGAKVGLGAKAGQMTVQEVAEVVKARGPEAEEIRIVTCTEGNWGRAVGRMARELGVTARIFVPGFMDEATKRKIGGEGAEVVVVDGDFDASVEAARGNAEDGGLLVMDVGEEGYEEIPGWVVEGYTTMLTESDRQIAAACDRPATHAFVPVGAGSVAQAVTQHFKGVSSTATTTTPTTTASARARVVAVEPTNAASLREALAHGRISPIITSETIMCGMNCGTVSETAWPALRDGVDASALVTDSEAHAAVLAMEAEGIGAGPCGASTLAGLRVVAADEGTREALDLGPESVVVLFSTEGTRGYVIEGGGHE